MLEDPGAVLVALPGQQMVVQRPGHAVGQVQVAQRGPQRTGHGQGVGAGGGGVGDVQRHRLVALPHRVPGGRVCLEVSRGVGVAGSPGEHVLHRQVDARGRLALRDPGDEGARVTSLPEEGRVQHHRGRLEVVGQLDGAIHLVPRIGAEDPAGHQQRGSVDRQHRLVVLLHQGRQPGGVLGCLLTPDHDLDAVVAQLLGDGEGVGNTAGNHTGGRQPHRNAHCPAPSSLSAAQPLSPEPVSSPDSCDDAGAPGSLRPSDREGRRKGS